MDAERPSTTIDGAVLAVGPESLAASLGQHLAADVDGVRDAGGALDDLDSREYAAVVTLYDLSGGDGSSLLDRVADRRNPPVTILAVRTDAHAREQALAAGASHVVDPEDRDSTRALANRVRTVTHRSPVDSLADTSLRRLHDTARSFTDCEHRTAVYDRTVEAAQLVLDLDYCLIDVVEDDQIVPVAVSRHLDPEDYETVPVADGGLAGEAYRTGDASIVGDVSRSPIANDTAHDYRSILTVPFADDCLFQAGSETVDAFDQRDMELSELLLSHASESIERIDTDRELRDRERFLSTLISNLPGMAYRCVKDPGRPMQFVSEGCRDLTGYDPERLTSGSVVWGEEVIVPADQDRVWDPVQDAIEHRKPFEVTYRIRTADGDVRWVWEQGRAVEYEGDPILEGFITDITERKRRERELTEQTERLDAFARVLSHDLRNPLTVATGHLEAARFDDEDTAAHLDGIATAHDRMTEIVDGVLALVRGREDVSDDTPIALSDVVEDAWTTVDTAEMTLDVDDDLGIVYADGPLLGQVFENLFRNAREHAGSAATVRVGSLSEEGFYVEDDGPNLPLSIRQTAFDLGERADSVGTGTGLAIVRRIVAAHDWSVSHSESAAGGARFAFRTDSETGTEGLRTDQ